MKESYWAYWIILLGVFVIVVMMVIQNYTTQNTEDYYLIKEITEAALIDAVDYGYYRANGQVKINREKFIENFLRRFAESASLSRTYTVEFYRIFESPPKVNVKVSSKTNSYAVMGDSTTFDIVNKVNARIELKQE